MRQLEHPFCKLQGENIVTPMHMYFELQDVGHDAGTNWGQWGQLGDVLEQTVDDTVGNGEQLIYITDIRVEKRNHKPEHTKPL